MRRGTAMCEQSVISRKFVEVYASQQAKPQNITTTFRFTGMPRGVTGITSWYKAPAMRHVYVMTRLCDKATCVKLGQKHVDGTKK